MMYTYNYFKGGSSLPPDKRWEMGPSAETIEAFRAYAKEVQSGQYPDTGHSYHMKPGELEKLQRLLSDQV